MSPEGKERPDAQQQLGLNPIPTGHPPARSKERPRCAAAAGAEPHHHRPSTRQKQGAPAMRSSSWGWTRYLPASVA